MIGVKQGNFLMHHDYHIIISGQVQGVFFRSKTKKYADRMGLKGTVRNASNGDVEICLAGTREDADRLIQAMQAEPPPIEITSVKVKESSSSRSYSDFSIVH